MSKKEFSGNEAGAIHPLVGSILGNMGLIESAMSRGEREPALEHLKMALVKVKPADVPEGLLGEVDRERAYLAGLQPTRRNERMRVCATFYEGLVCKAWGVFWSRGYLSGEAYKEVLPTAMDNKSGALKGTPLPGILSSRLEGKTP